jgi:hypothetical protein
LRRDKHGRKVFSPVNQVLDPESSENDARQKYGELLLK